tara:strand:- start:42 stop:389 length:348 start_codon:yes stop_codon:yes gene_type:complete
MRHKREIEQVNARKITAPDWKPRSEWEDHVSDVQRLVKENSQANRWGRSLTIDYCDCDHEWAITVERNWFADNLSLSARTRAHLPRTATIEDLIATADRLTVDVGEALAETVNPG